jgi:hypothetical protein
MMVQHSAQLDIGKDQTCPIQMKIKSCQNVELRQMVKIQKACASQGGQDHNQENMMIKPSSRLVKPRTYATRLDVIS